MSDLSLINNWHEKAKEDYFSRYVFEYMAFEAFLKKYKYSEDDIYNLTSNKKERSYIQALKNDVSYVTQWSELVTSDQRLQETATDLIAFLNNEPLATDSNWWGCTAYEHNQCPQQGIRGVIVADNDFVNVVEFWYQVRNNLFHAGKDPDSKRDEQLVALAYNTLAPFMEKVLIAEMEQRTMVPSSWEDFEHRFFAGQAEAQVKTNNGTGCANVYELLFIDDEALPVLFEGTLIDRKYIVDRVVFELTNLYGDDDLFTEAWDRVKSYARTPEQRDIIRQYFKPRGYFPIDDEDDND
jgi:hypothetical protein